MPITTTFVDSAGLAGKETTRETPVDYINGQTFRSVRGSWGGRGLVGRRMEGSEFVNIGLIKTQNNVSFTQVIMRSMLLHVSSNFTGVLNHQRRRFYRSFYHCVILFDEESVKK